MPMLVLIDESMRAQSNYLKYRKLQVLRSRDCQEWCCYVIFTQHARMFALVPFGKIGRLVFVLTLHSWRG